MARARKGRKFPQPGGNYSFRVLAVSTGVFVVANLILLVASTTTASFQYKVGTIYKAPENIPEALVSRLDAILVLGGGVPTSLEEPPIYVQRRCDDAATVVTQKKTLLKQRRGQDSYSTDIPILCLSAGTAHLHQLMDPQGLPIWESTSSAAYLKKKHGLTHLFVETASYDTIGNAFYARTGHTDLADWRRLLIITNEFHMERTKAIFDWVYGVDKRGYELYYLSSPDVGLSEEALKVRREKESASLEAVRKYTSQYRSLKDVWYFLVHFHGLYTADKLMSRGKASQGATKDAELIKSYGGQL